MVENSKIGATNSFKGSHHSGCEDEKFPPPPCYQLMMFLHKAFIADPFFNSMDRLSFSNASLFLGELSPNQSSSIVFQI